jgi:hypothetical protein
MHTAKTHPIAPPAEAGWRRWSTARRPSASPSWCRAALRAWSRTPRFSRGQALWPMRRRSPNDCAAVPTACPSHRCMSLAHLPRAVRRCRHQGQPRRGRVPGGDGDRSRLRVGHHRPRLQPLQGPALAPPLAVGRGRHGQRRVPHSITSSARNSSDCGSLTPSRFAVPRLIDSCNFTGRSIGSSAGRAPFRILSM